MDLPFLGREGQKSLIARDSFFESAQRLQGEPFLLPSARDAGHFLFYNRKAL
jgi:hypothetical protein